MEGIPVMPGSEMTWQDKVSEWVFFVGPIMQVLFWAIMAVVMIMALVYFKRWVDYATGVAKLENADAPVSAPEAAADKVDVDAFVE